MELGENNTVTQDTAVDSVVLTSTSEPFVGRWNQLVTKTNWEKGRIIYQWREALIASGASSDEYSDEAWSARVGGVTGQHVGRLRRVYQHFGQTFDRFEGLYWSHFQAALDWDDAEMWLEGALQNGWSVSQMRTKRWETMGALEADQPNPKDEITGELDEDFEPAINEAPQRTVAGAVDDGPLDEGPDFGDESRARDNGDPDAASAPFAEEPPSNDHEPTVQPFAHLTELPEDLAAAFDAFKLAILRHKLEGWQEINQADVLASLDALKQLALAPSE